MPTLVITGINEDGLSYVSERRPLSADEPHFEAYRLDQAIVPIAASSPDAELMASPTAPGGAVVRIWPWRPGQRTRMHRTITTDIDVVLEGSVVLELEAETVTL